MNRWWMVLLVGAMASGQEITPDKRLEHATAALRAFLSSDSNIPKELTGKAQCLVVVPRLMKGAFLIGGKFGRGFASCRRVTGGWTPPAAIAIEGGSFGPQLGASSTDLIVVVTNQRGMDRLMGDKFTLGGDAAIAAGPVGADASVSTDLLMTAEMISYSQSKGLFAGFSLEGATLRPDGPENKKMYGHDVPNRDILQGKVKAPKGAVGLVTMLNRRARKGK